MPEMGTEEKEPSTTSFAYFYSIWNALFNWSVIISYAVVFMRFFIKYGVYTFLPFMVLKYGMSAAEAGLVFSMMSLGLASVATQVKRLANSRFHIKYIVLTGMVFIGIVSIGFSLATSLISFLFVGLLYGIVEGFAAGPETSLLTQNTARDIRDGIVSIGSWVRNLGKTISPLFFLYVATHPEIFIPLSNIPFLDLDPAAISGPDYGFIISGLFGTLGAIMLAILIAISWLLKKINSTS